MDSKSVTPLERIRKVYKDKVTASEKFTYSSIHRQQYVDEQKDIEMLNEDDIEITAEDLKAKRDLKYQNAYLHALSGQVANKLGDFQYRVRGSSKSLEVDNQ